MNIEMDKAASPGGYDCRQYHSTPVEKSQDERKYQSELSQARKAFHQAIISRVREIHFLDTPEIIEKVKRSFLWFEFCAETSRSLNINYLREAIRKIKKMDIVSISSHLEKMYPPFSTKDYCLLTGKQRNKLVRILKYVCDLDSQQIMKYVESSIGRWDWVGHLTVREADKVIKRAEQWEAKILLKK